MVRQRGANGSWSAWSAPMCAAPEIEVEEEARWFGCLTGSRGGAFLLLPLVALARRRRDARA